ncbi:hypothetical protein Poly30_47220 [Planctomycetes bacterium Poly30]|uniref:Uncharacterized protein n=1 Tax=Saltatorellus ferox TaxID=2528018 RepID=A0A518EYK0_9BACT|nr:hypothetical protein Poly30_47220 [Planctomycetes bacterium Poly30]
MKEREMDRDDLLRRLAVPTLAPAEVERMVAAAMPIGSVTPAAAGRPRWIGWVSHAAAILLGMLIAHGALRGLDDGEIVTDQRTTLAVAAPEVREVRVEVPVEVPVEVVVEVPVETIVEKIVEVPVEVEKTVERIVYRDRIVENPLQARWDRQLRIADMAGQVSVLALAGIGRAYEDLQARVQRSAELQVIASADPVQGYPPSETRRAALSSASASRAHVEVRREGARVTLRTRGTLSEVIPVLIDTMESEDSEVVAAAFDRLQSIRVDLGEEALDLRDTEGARAPGGGLRGMLFSRGAEAPAVDLRDPLVWRDWWARQQVASGMALIATSI